MDNNVYSSKEQQLIALIIDGEERMRNFIKKHLTRLGFTCFCTDDYEMALQAVVQGRILPDIILVSDSQEALQHANEIIQTCTNHTCLILSYSSPQECDNTYPGIIHLRRPVIISEFYSTINNLIAEKNLCQL